MTQPDTGQNLRVNVAGIIDQIHTRYSKQIAMLVQENAELAAGQDVVMEELKELRSKLDAITKEYVELTDDYKRLSNAYDLATA